MGLSNDLLSQFVKMTNDTPKDKKEATVYGTVVTYNGAEYVKLDGSDLLTPINSTTEIVEGERVTVTIKDHTATVMGNITTPSASVTTTDNLGNIIDQQGNTISQINNVINQYDNRITQIGNTVIQQNNTINQFNNTINQQNSTIETMNSTIKNQVSIIANINSEVVNQNSKIETLDSTVKTHDSSIDIYNSSFQVTDGVVTGIKGVDTDWISTKELEADHATIGSLDSNYANIDFANIGKAAFEYFYAKSGLIENVVVGDQTITGELVGVTIRGDRIIGNTIMADKLVIKGEDGLFYKLNTDGMTVEKEQTNENSLNGQVIAAKSITATKIDVKDLVAFGATIGGFSITDNSIYSGVKESVDNTTRGVYLDNSGQIALGDATNFIKYYKDSTTGAYKLNISADDITFGSSKKSVETAINEIEIGGRNLLLNTKTMERFQHNAEVVLSTDDEGVTVASWPTRTNPSWIILSTIPIDYEMVKNRKVTFSMLVKSEDYEALNADTTHGLVVTMRVCNDSSMTAINNKDKNYYDHELSDKWTKITWTGVITDEWFASGSGDMSTATRFYISVFDYSTYRMDVKKLQLEFGDKATDWVEAPEDVQTRITSLDNDIVNWCYDNDKTYINGNKIYAHSISSNQLATNAIKSLNYVKDSTGSFLNLEDGAFDSKHLKWTKEGVLTATSGTIGGNIIDETGIYADNVIQEGWTDEGVYFKPIANGFRIDSSGYIETYDEGSGRDYYATLKEGQLTLYSASSAGSNPYEMVVRSEGVYLTVLGTNNGSIYVSQSTGKLTLDGDHGVELIGDTSISGKLSATGAISSSSSITSASALISNGGAVELFGATPFIDFHYGSSSADYTSRLIANAANKLTCTSDFAISGKLNMTGEISIGQGDGYGIQLGKNGRINATNSSGSTTCTLLGISSAANVFLGHSSFTTAIRGSTVQLSSSSSSVSVGAGYFSPTANNTVSCGTSTNKWSSVYAVKGTIQTSDRNLKKDINTLDVKYEQLHEKLIPVSYGLNYPDSDRIHLGFISQGVKEAMDEVGLTDLDFAGFCKDIKQEMNEETGEMETVLDENGDPEYSYSLRYTEFIALNTHMIQKQQKRIDELEDKVAKLEGLVQQLLDKDKSA